VNLPVTQIKRMSKDEVEDRLREHAIEQIEKARLARGLAKYLEPLYAEGELANWGAREVSTSRSTPKEFVVEDERDAGGRRRTSSR